MTEPPRTKAELLDLIGERWNALQEVLEPLNGRELVAPLPGGWNVAQHITHVAIWERSLLGLLEKQPRWEAMGVPRELWESHDTDAINAYIAEWATKQPLDELIGLSSAAHHDLMKKLESMSQDDFERPYSEYQPFDPEPNANPVGGWVHGNTWDHYNEHIDWLEAGLAKS